MNEKTMNILHPSWVESANNPEGPFPLNNLAYGVFDDGKGARCGVAIGDFVLDVKMTHWKSVDIGLFAVPNWNAFMNAGTDIWNGFRAELQDILAADSSRQDEVTLISLGDVDLLMPFEVSEYTDFYAGRHHATNVGTMFRGAENALPPNWLHIPIGYNGRASSIVVSGTDIRRPYGQLKLPDHDLPVFMPSRRFDIELEIGAIVGQASQSHISVKEADENIFGYVLLNDWSARDIQAWEYQPLGPFQAKATATTISPWIITKAALEPFRVDTPARDYALLAHLKDDGPMLYDIELEIDLTPEGGKTTTIARTNYKEMYYSSAQQLSHHTSSGCPMRVGDLLGSGTISGPNKMNRGSLLELSWGGKEPLTLDDGTVRSFIEDGDLLNLRGFARGNGYIIGFGDCSGKLLPAQ